MAEKRAQDGANNRIGEELETNRAQWIAVAPKLAVVALVMITVLIFHSNISDLLNRTTKVGYAGFSIETADVTLRRAGRVTPPGVNVPPMSDAERQRIIQRYAHLAEMISSSRILWVDDNPRPNSSIVDFLEITIGRVDIARSTSEAALRLEEKSYDVVISDFSREADPTQQNGPRPGSPPVLGAGVELANRVAADFCGTRVILFSSVGPEQRSPAHVFAQTNRTYDLLTAVANALESGRDPGCNAAGG